MSLLKDRTFIILFIIILIIVGLSVIVFYTSPMNGPSKIITPSPINGVCSVSGYVVDSNGSGVSGAFVILYVIRSNNDSWGDAWDYEFYNMTTTTNSVPPLVGFFKFDNVTFTSLSDYAYLSASKPIDRYSYIPGGESNKFTLTNQANINRSVVIDFN